MLSTMRSLAALPRRSIASGPSPLWKLAHGMFDPETPMTTPMPGISPPEYVSAPEPSAVAVTTLPNGVRVASQDLGGSVSAIGIFVGAGSRHETPFTAGSTHLLEHMAFKGSAQRSKYRVIRDSERTGGSYASAASRESMSYTAEVMRTEIDDTVSILAESATRPAIAVKDESSVEWDPSASEIAETVKVIKAELKDFSLDPSGRVTEAVHAAAYHGNTLGLPLVAETRKLDALTPASVSQFMTDNVFPENLVVAAANVDHDDLVRLGEASLGSFTGSSSGSDSMATYTGGSVRISGDGPGHFALAFEGVSWNDDDLIPVCVLHTLLGGGGSFSSGGPGKGMYTRLFSDILNRHGWISSAVAFNHCYSDSGVFGIHASCGDPANLNSLIEVVTSQVGKMAAPLAKDELTRAKNMTKSALVLNLESRAVVCEDIGRQILGSGKYVSGKELSRAIDAVDESAIIRVAQRMLSTKPSVVLHGEEYATHAYDAIEGSVKSHVKIAA